MTPTFQEIAKHYTARSVEELNEKEPYYKAQRQILYENAIENKEGCRVWDVTSLYPFVMSNCAMPTGKLYFLSKSCCEESINSIYCKQCEDLLTICPAHRSGLKTNPFAIIMIKNLKFDTTQDSIRNYCPRKNKDGSLVYSREEMIEGSNAIQSFTNIDLYWMKRQKCTFEIVSGFGFQTSMKFSSFIKPAFQMRIVAKQEGNKTLSNFLKLLINGSYGVTVQRDIASNWAVVTLPPELIAQKDSLAPNDPKLLSFLLSGGTGTVEIGPDDQITDILHLPNNQSLIQLKKRDNTYESFSELAPIQIGAAVLAYARHVLNLIMFKLSPYDILYTDTDSINLTERAYHIVKDINPALFCEDADAPMGTYKNDVGENNGTNPIIIFAAIGAKKVKMYVTLNKEGDMKVFNTFKGMNPINYKKDATIEDNCDEDNDSTATPICAPLHMHPDFIEYKLSKCLLDILFNGTPRNVVVSQWKRRIRSGIEITSHIQTGCDSTYFGFHSGLAVTKTCSGIIEHYIPHGFTGSYTCPLSSIIPFHYALVVTPSCSHDLLVAPCEEDGPPPSSAAAAAAMALRYTGGRGESAAATPAGGQLKRVYFEDIIGWNISPEQIYDFFRNNVYLFPMKTKIAYHDNEQYNQVVAAIRRTYYQ
jgi:hypothetical protein